MSANLESNEGHTLRYGQKCDHRDSVAMHATHPVLHVADGHIQGIIFVLSGSDGHSGLVAAQDYGNERCASSAGA